MTILKEGCEKASLEMHAEKTKAMTNGISDKGDNCESTTKAFQDKANARAKTRKERNCTKDEVTKRTSQCKKTIVRITKCSIVLCLIKVFNDVGVSKETTRNMLYYRLTIICYKCVI